MVVTGSSGQLGSAVVQMLRRDGIEVVGLDRRPGPGTRDGMSMAERGRKFGIDRLTGRRHLRNVRCVVPLSAVSAVTL